MREIHGDQELVHQVLRVSAFGHLLLFDSLPKCDTDDAARTFHFLKYGVEVVEGQRRLYDLLFDALKQFNVDGPVCKEVLGKFADMGLDNSIKFLEVVSEGQEKKNRHALVVAVLQRFSLLSEEGGISPLKGGYAGLNNAMLYCRTLVAGESKLVASLLTELEEKKDGDKRIRNVLHFVIKKRERDMRIYNALHGVLSGLLWHL